MVSNHTLNGIYKIEYRLTKKTKNHIKNIMIIFSNLTYELN